MATEAEQAASESPTARTMRLVREEWEAPLRDALLSIYNGGHDAGAARKAMNALVHVAPFPDCKCGAPGDGTVSCPMEEVCQEKWYRMRLAGPTSAAMPSTSTSVGEHLDENRSNADG
jgi:hypothetical protein